MQRQSFRPWLLALTGALVLALSGVTVACDSDDGSPAADVVTGDAGADASIPPGDVGSGDTTVTPDGGGSDAGTTDVTVSCSGMQRDLCIESPHCVLEIDVAADQYTCRAARNDCERVTDPVTCDSAQGCLWYPGSCYCEEDAPECFCAGGPAPSCRAAGAPYPCRTDAYEGQYDCRDDQECCPIPGEPLGVCHTEGGCIGTASACATLVSMRRAGGLCMDGACSSEVRVQGEGYVFFDDETPSTPVDGQLEAADLVALQTLLAAIDPVALWDGYGACCAADSDGSDAYVTFYGKDAPIREVRISVPAEAPQNLQNLMALLDQASAELRGGEYPIAACPGLSGVPARDEELPAATCDNADTLGAAAVYWTLSGPNGEQMDAGSIVLEASGVPETEPVMWTLEGTVVDAAGGSFTLQTTEQDDWDFAVNQLDPDLPLPCFVEGQSLTVAAYGLPVWDGVLLGLVIRDARGVLFASDTGLTEVHAQITDAPFVVEPNLTRCPAGEPGQPQADSLVFRAGDNTLELLTSEWGRLEIDSGYDLAVLNLRSFRSMAPDDVEYYKYVAYAIAGSDTALCGGGE